MAGTLLGHLAVNLAASPENVATEALGYILRRSGAARDSLNGLLARVGMTNPPELVFRNQASGETGATPDLVGMDGTGNEPLIIEAKFWAGLTHNQPKTYLSRLPRDGEGVLLFVSPAQRVEFLWSELVRRCEIQREDVRRPANGLITGRVGAHHYLAITSWRQVLTDMKARLESDGDRVVAGDVEQLEGLCERMDSQAFLPVTPDELSAGIYRRVIDFGSMIDDISNHLVGERLASKKGLKTGAGLGYYGRYLSLYNVGVLLSCDIRKWTTLCPTPLWLTVFGPDFSNLPNPLVRNALAPLEAEVPSRVFVATDGAPGAGLPTVPLFVRPQAERDGVVAYVVAQVQEVALLLKPIGVASRQVVDQSPPAEARTVDEPTSAEAS